MPHKRQAVAKPAVQGHVERLKDLAKALGVTDDTITAWRRRGMPAAGARGPWSVVEVYLWAKAAGLNPRLPDDEALVAIIRQRQRPAPATAAPPTTGISNALLDAGRLLGIDPPREADLEDEEKRLLSWQRWASSVQSAMEILASRRQLIPREQVRPFLLALSAEVHAADVDLPALVAARLGEAQLTAAQLEAVRSAVAEARREQATELQASAERSATQIVRRPA